MKHSPFTPTLLGALVLAVGVLCWFGYQWFAERQAAAAERTEILRDVDVELGRRPVDAGELSRLVARIRKLEDHGTASDLLRAQARIALARDRADRARQLFLPVASAPGAAPGDRALAAEILLEVQAAGVSDRGLAIGMLEEVIRHGEAAFAATADPADLLRAWLAALRLADAERSRAIGERLRAACAGTPEAGLVDAGRGTPLGELQALRADFDDPPPEVDVLIAMVTLEGGDVQGSLRVVEPLLVRGAGILDVRLAAVAAFQARMLGCAVDSAERERWRVRRDAQLDWLLDWADPDDPRRAAWAELRELR